MREIVDSFGGYNHNLRIGDGEFSEMRNMSSDGYPVLMPRRERGRYVDLLGGSPATSCMIAKDKLCYVDGTGIVIGNERVDLELSEDVVGSRSLVSFGAYVIVVPDAVYVNTMDVNDKGSISASYRTNGASWGICPWALGSNHDAEIIVGDVGDSGISPVDGQLWLCTKDQYNPVLRRYNEAAEKWVDVDNSYTKVEAKGIGKVFSQYDSVYIHTTDTDLSGATMFDAGYYVIYEIGTDYIVIQSTIKYPGTYSWNVEALRKFPELDYYIECGNRLWGCKYGTNSDGEMVNEIYASKLGDFKNWNCYMGVSTDSYTASCGTDGPFTGAITYMGYPMFFKENCFHKVYGSYPAQFQIQTTECRGVQDGCNKSLVIVNETLLYKSRDAICAYDGSLPVEISYNLGRVLSKAAIAGAYDSKYYISNKDPQGNKRLYVYDMEKELWHVEDEFYPVDYCTHNGVLYAIDQKTKRILTMGGEGDPAEDTMEWYVETGEIGIASPDMKYLTNLLVRMSMDVGSEVCIHTKHDFEEEWELAYALSTSSLRSFSIPIRPKRCDHLKLRIEGRGMAKIYSITKTIEQGSDRS